MTENSPASAEEMKAIAERCKKAFGRMTMHRRRLRDIYKYAMPFRKGVGVGGEAATDDKDLAEVYDSTAISSTFRSAGKLKNSMFPDGEKFFTRRPTKISKKIKAYLKATDQDDETFRSGLQDDDGVVDAIFKASDWSVSSHEYCLDLMAGHASTFAPPCPEKVVRFITVPADNVANDVDATGDVTGVYWPTRFTGRELIEDFPDAPWPEKLRKELQDNPEKHFPVSIDTIRRKNKSGGREWLLVWRHRDMETVPIKALVSKTCPWIIGRYYRIPGEERGRGLLDIALATIKTINQTQEFILKAAALAVLGVFLVSNEAGINPETIQLSPGSLIPVQRTGGTLGPSLQRLDAPGRFDVSQLIINEMRMQIREILGDGSLPGDAAVRSATEVADRIKRLADEHIGAVSRLHKETVVALVSRVTELAGNAGLLTLNGPFDELLVETLPTSPLAVAGRAAKFKIFFDWLQAIAQFAPALLPIVAKLSTAAVEFGRELGVPEHLMSPEKEQEGTQALIEQLVQQKVQQLMDEVRAEAKAKATAAKKVPAEEPANALPV